jgi:alpha-beta hydrolase superfamily lysophospholipase
MVERHGVGFFADGLLLDGELVVPGETSTGAGVVVLGGYPGHRTNVPRIWGEALAERGLVALGFDHRGMNASAGPRGRLWPQERVEDVRAAVSFLQQQPEGSRGVALVGWAQGGAVAIAEAADDERVAAVVAVNPVGDAGRMIRRLHTDESWATLQTALADDRGERQRTGASRLVDPFTAFPLDPVTAEIVRDKFEPMPAWGSPVTLDSAEAMLRFRPEDVVHRVAPRPLLLVHGDRNTLHLPEESERLLARAGEPRQLHLLPGKGHLGWAEGQDPETFEAVLDRIASFVVDALR